MTKYRFKTKLSKRQKKYNVIVFLLILICSYLFTLGFGFSIGLFEDWTMPEILILGLALSFFILSMLMFPVLLAACALGVQNGQAKRVCDDATYISTQDIEYYRENLSELSPSIVSLLIDLDLYGKKDIVATLLRMQNKKVISLQNNGEIFITGQNADMLNTEEQDLLSMIQAGVLSSKQWFEIWKQRRFYNAESLGYIEKTAAKVKYDPKIIFLGIVSFFASIVLWKTFLFSDMFSTLDAPIDLIKPIAILLTADFLLSWPFYFLCRKSTYNKREDILWKRTALGNETAEKIAGLARYIHEFSLLSEANKEQVALWDDYLVYAIVLEENEKIVDDICKIYNNDAQGLHSLLSSLV